MKIDLNSIDLTQFDVTDHTLNNGEVVCLVTPQRIDVKWNQQNKILRSSVWNKNTGELVSAGYPKFCNFGENPENFPLPTSLYDSCIVAKLDGSLLIYSKVNGEYILRTRGTTDATKLETGYELEIFKKNFLPVLNLSCNNEETWPTSFLFEWLTASKEHKIILNYDEVPDWILIGAVNHEDYSLYEQDTLDVFAKSCGFKRPEKFKFNNIDEMLSIVKGWVGKEGVVLYTESGQKLFKIKSDWYSKLHRFKSNATLENTIELFFQFGKPEFIEFQNKVAEIYDWECLQLVRGYISNICDAYKEVVKIENHMFDFVQPLKLVSRKDAAQKILSSYANSSRSSFCFTLLDNKPLNDEQLKKLLWQSLKK